MIVRALNRLLAKKIEGLEYAEVALATVEPKKCKLHLKYRGLKPPSATKDGCTCQAYYEELMAAAKRPKQYEPVFRESELLMANEISKEVVRQLYKFPDELKDPAAEAERSFLSPSKTGGCVVKACLEKLGCKPEPLSTRSKLTFMFGSILEGVYRYLLRTASFDEFKFIETKDLQKVTVGGEAQRGYYDGVVEVSIERLKEEVGGSDEFWDNLKKKLGKDRLRILFEMKSKSDYGFKDLAKTGEMDNEFGYRSQMGYYLKQAWADGVIDVPLGVWFVVNKNTAAVLELYVSLKQLEDDLALSEKNYAIVKSVVVDNKPLPQRPYELQSNGAIPKFPCGYCDQKWTCWTDGVVTGFELVDADSENTRWKPVYENELSQWLEVEFDKKGAPMFVVYEKGGNDE